MQKRYQRIFKTLLSTAYKPDQAYILHNIAKAYKMQRKTNVVRANVVRYYKYENDKFIMYAQYFNKNNHWYLGYFWVENKCTLSFRGAILRSNTSADFIPYGCAVMTYKEMAYADAIDRGYRQHRDMFPTNIVVDIKTNKVIQMYNDKVNIYHKHGIQVHVPPEYTMYTREEKEFFWRMI